jgi:uncharacterized protein (UPF0303 family)
MRSAGRIEFLSGVAKALAVAACRVGLDLQKQDNKFQTKDDYKPDNLETKGGCFWD